MVVPPANTEIGALKNSQKFSQPIDPKFVENLKLPINSLLEIQSLSMYHKNRFAFRKSPLS